MSNPGLGQELKHKIFIELVLQVQLQILIRGFSWLIEEFICVWEYGNKVKKELFNKGAGN